MKPVFFMVLALAAVALAGCSTEPPAGILSEPPELDPATATPQYWLQQPSAATVYCANYDQLWQACDGAARLDLFEPDRQDYRDGLLTTKPLVSRQFFEFWRPDTGDRYGVIQNSLQTIRRTIQFEFSKNDGGYIVSPKVLIERLARNNRQITDTAEYRIAFQKPVGGEKDEYWFAAGRDLAMEADLAKAINRRVHPG